VLTSVAEASGDRVTVHPIDVSSAASIEACARELADTPIDILINNAGVSSARQTLQDMDFESWGQLFNTMVVGPFRISRAFIPNLRAGRKPRIVTLSSVLGSSLFSLGGYYAYSSCKAAVGRVMRTLATDLKDQNIIVAIVHPGWVKTDMGGPEADLTAERSISGVRHVIAKLTLADSGSFFNWDGNPHPW
jgi:NAD(P)-dependent dehydrogenase (short-subunit alcohol dehydrogenase family)